MKKPEWQRHYEFSDDDMNRIDIAVKMFNGKICEIKLDTQGDFSVYYNHKEGRIKNEKSKVHSKKLPV